LSLFTPFICPFYFYRHHCAVAGCRSIGAAFIVAPYFFSRLSKVEKRQLEKNLNICIFACFDVPVWPFGSPDSVNKSYPRIAGIMICKMGLEFPVVDKQEEVPMRQ